MTQPEETNIPGLITELFSGFGIARVDVTEFQSGPVPITRGRADEGSDVEPGSMSLTLKNLDGRFSPRNPNSPYFGTIGRNTPIHVRLEDNLAAGIRLRNLTQDVNLVLAWAWANDAASLDITTDIDVRIEITPDTWSPVLPQVLMAKYEPSAGNASWYFRMGAASNLQWIWSSDGTNGVATVSSDPLPLALTQNPRGAVRVTFDVNNGAGGRTTRFYWAESLDGPWTEFDSVTAAGTTSIFNGAARVGVGATGAGTRGFIGSTGFNGVVHRAEIYNGINGTLISNPNFREYFTILQKNENTVGGVADDFGHAYFLDGFTEVERPDIRASMEIVNWAPRWDSSGRDVDVDIEAAGVLRRIGSPGRPQDDVVKRFMLSFNAFNMLNYWPLSDPDGVTQAASGIDAPPMKVGFRRTAPLFGRGNLNWYLPAAAETGEGNGRIEGLLLGGNTGGFTMDLAVRAADPASGTGNEEPVAFSFDIRTQGDTAHPDGVIWIATINTITNIIALTAADIETGSVIVTDDVPIDTTNILDGQMHHLRMRTTEGAGTNTNWFLDLDRVNLLGFSFNLGVTTTPAPTRAGVEWIATTPQVLPWSFGQIAVFGNPPPGLFDVNDAMIGFAGEPAAERVRRLVAEENLVPVVYGDRLDSPAMGPQRPVTGLESMREAIATDGGFMLEARDWPTIAVKPLSYLVNQPALMTLDYAMHEVAVPFHPNEDDQNLRNDVTTTQQGTSETARVIQETGPLSVQDPPSGAGQYPENLDASVQLATQLPSIAGRRVLRGTWPESRYPQLSVAVRYTEENLRNLPLRDAMLLADSGRRADVVNLPSWLPPEDARLFIQGYTETITPEDHDIVFNSTPYGPYVVGQLPDPGVEEEFGLQASRVDTGGSELADDLNVGVDTSMLVATLDGPVWFIDETEYPEGFDVVLTEGFQEVESAILRVTDVDSYAADNWNRSVANPNWGSTSTGAIPWARSGTATNVTTSVNGTRGLIVRAAAGNSYMSLTGISFSDMEAIVSVDSSVATGFGGLVLRFGVPTGSDLCDGYGVVINAASRLLEVYDNISSGSVSTLLGSSPIPNWVINTQWRIRARVVGSTISARVWPVGIAEPFGWTVVVTDTTHAFGSIGMQRINTGETRFDNFEITSPQIFTIQPQAVNGVTKNIAVSSLPVGVRLANPIRPGG